MEVKNMKKLETDYFIIYYQDELRQFVQNSLNHFDNKIGLLNMLFGDDIQKIGKVECAFFTKRQDFENYIKSITNGRTPPSWATGCFYNNGIQVLVNNKNKNKLVGAQNILAHEFTHLCIVNLIYQPFHVKRVRWLDESFARFVDGHLDNVSNEELKSCCEALKSINKNFDINDLDDIQKVMTKEYNGYQMFDVIGKYIFENNLQKQYLELLRTDEKQIRQIGKSILNTSLEYVENSTRKELNYNL